jgi:hypothetical protein
METRKWWLMSVLTAALVLVGTVMAQPQEGRRGPGGGFQGGKGGKGKGKGKGGNLSAAEIVDRIMSFDKNNDGKITKDELPERLHYLIERGDTNKDGVLDKAEIQQLASTIAQDARSGVRAPGFGGPGGGKGPPAGFRGKGGPGGFEQQALNELNLTGKSKDKAEAVVRTHQENVRKLVELARSDLLLKMKDVLSDQEYKTFKENLERRPNPPPGPPAGATRTADLERRFDQLQRQVEDLRREIKR